MNSAERSKEWRKNNPEKSKESRKRWIKNNLEKNQEIQKKYRESHKEKRKDWQKKYAKNNGEKIKAHGLVHKKKIPLKDKCESCGVFEKLEHHHPDYDKPLITETLCKNCHNNIHKGGKINGKRNNKR